MNIVHLTASTLHGGPERQMLGLAHHLPETDQSLFLSFAEGGRCRQFLSTARHHGFEAVGLRFDTPHLWAAVREIAGHLRARRGRRTVLSRLQGQPAGPNRGTTAEDPGHRGRSGMDR